MTDDLPCRPPADIARRNCLSKVLLGLPSRHPPIMVGHSPLRAPGLRLPQISRSPFGSRRLCLKAAPVWHIQATRHGEDPSEQTYVASKARYICGLRQNATDRSNVAVMHAGNPEDGEIVLRLTVSSGTLPFT